MNHPGRLHPITIAIREMADIFGRMGFGVVSGISSDQFNLSSGGGGAGAGGDGTLIGDTSSTPEPGSLFLATLGMAAIFVSRIIAWFDRNRQTL